jgi:trimeric autotransporter adhesin
MAIINGNNLNNTLFGTGALDDINGFGGDDLINGGGGGDNIDGGSGNDILLGDAGDDFIFGDSGDDTLFGGAGNDVLQDGGEGSPLDGNNIYDGGEGDDTITGGTGNDLFYLNSGNDIVTGGGGNDMYFVHGDDSGFGAVEISDSSGIDTLNFSLVRANTFPVDDINGVDASLQQGATSFIEGRSIQITSGVDIENAIGSDFGDRIIGNTLANRIEGGAGNDRLFGREGGDTLIADGGADYLGGGIQTRRNLQSTGTVTNAPFQTLTVTTEVGDESGHPTNFNVAAQGTSIRASVKFDLVLLAGAGETTSFALAATVFDPGTGTQVPLNFIVEGTGSEAPIDTFGANIVNDGPDPQIIQNDVTLILVGLDPGLSQFVTISLTATQLDGATRTESHSFEKVDLGGTVSGDDTLDGGANGAGVTTMAGGDGNDTYLVRDSADKVQENADEGTDAVQSGISYTLGFAVENLILLGGGDINGTGNGLDNTITGNSGNNTLNGGGGNDTMAGGGGNDTYIVAQTGDVVVELPGGGTDRVISSLVNYTLTANVENGELDVVFGTSLTGNALDNILTGNGGNNVLNGGAGNDTMAGGFGNDTYFISQANDAVQENLLGGTADLVVTFLANTILATNVERLILSTGAVNGTGNGLDNVITGNAAANALSGGLGNDTLDGAAGADTMNGGAGNDIYVVDSLLDTIVELSGVDTIQTSIQLANPLVAVIENLTLTGAAAINGFGNALANRIVGNGANNILEGFDNNDILEGGAGNDALNGGNGIDRLDGGLGNDTMTGGADNDVYIVGSTTDVVNELAGGGTGDRIETFVTLAGLAAEVEQLTLLGTAGLSGIGNALANRITGNIANNFIDGAGGVDVMLGGAGNDVYRIDVLGEAVVELAGEGTDRVESLVNHSLAPNVENLTLLGTANLQGAGNALANVMTGNSGDNVLNGLAGGDTMIGAAGNDTYVVDDLADTVIEGNVAGTDLVQSSVSFTLGNFVENLNLTGTAAIAGTGNGAANIINGNGADNILDGKAGADTMNGGLGNDVYVVDNAGDVVTDTGGTADLIQSSVTRTLEATIENLTLTGASAINGTGNALNNTILGNGLSNTLNGAGGNDTLDGGPGADTLTGGAGNDRFLFTFLEDNPDSITDFAPSFHGGADKLVISAAAFVGTLVAGAVVELQFAEGIPAPSGTNSQFLYNDLTGDLYFDQNGEDPVGVFWIATVPGGSFVLTNTDFEIVP